MKKILTTTAIAIAVICSSQAGRSHTLETFKANFSVDPKVEIVRKDGVNTITYSSQLSNRFLSVAINQYDDGNDGLDYQIDAIKSKTPATTSVSVNRSKFAGFESAELVFGSENKMLTVVKLICVSKRVDYRIIIVIDTRQVDEKTAVELCSRFFDSFEFVPILALLANS